MSVTDRLPDLSRPVTPRQYSRIAPLAFALVAATVMYELLCVLAESHGS